MNNLSIVIIAKNESINIYDCVKSANFADEVLVIDSGSKDDTVKLAKKAGAIVFTRKWLGYGAQKNLAINLAKGDWIFSLDADERINKKLAIEILSVIKKNPESVFEVSRKSLFVSKFMTHSGWSPDFTKRLFKKGAGIFQEKSVHEHFITDFKVMRLKESLIHYSYRDLETVLKKINTYSSYGANDYSKIKRKGSLSKAIMHGLWAFFRTYFIKIGFLDGAEGFMLAFANAEYSYYKYLKLYYLHRQLSVKKV
jgi:glycosyltransferase involved in cell wall biosynthesis